MPDGSYRCWLRLPDGHPIPVRVVDDDVIPPGEQVTSGEPFALAPRAAELGAHPQRDPGLRPIPAQDPPLGARMRKPLRTRRSDGAARDQRPHCGRTSTNEAPDSRA